MPIKSLRTRQLKVHRENHNHHTKEHDKQSNKVENSSG